MTIVVDMPGNINKYLIINRVDGKAKCEEGKVVLEVE